MKILHIALIAAAGYVAYDRNKTGSWIWEKDLSGSNKWTISVYNNSSTTPSNVYTANSESAARTIAQQATATWPESRVIVQGPNGQVF